MISVAMCTYNGSRFVREQLDSILSQIMPVGQLVIFDDCSTDGTYLILGEYKEKYPDIVELHRNESNKGFLKNFELALAECKGEYIFFSDQDDRWHNDKTLKMVEFMKSNDLEGVFTNGRLMDSNSSCNGEELFDYVGFRSVINNIKYKNLFEYIAICGNIITGATLAITKNAKQKVLPFRVSKGVYHDMWIGIRIAQMNKLGYMDKCLIDYRVHPSQQIGVNKESASQKESINSLFLLSSNTVHDSRNSLFECLLVSSSKLHYLVKTVKMNTWGIIRIEWKYLEMYNQLSRSLPFLKRCSNLWSFFSTILINNLKIVLKR